MNYRNVILLLQGFLSNLEDQGTGLPDLAKETNGGKWNFILLRVKYGLWNQSSKLFHNSISYFHLHSMTLTVLRPQIWMG